MKSSLLVVTAAASPALAGFDTWQSPGAYDVRAPCPMLNTLANHGFLPHDGKDITRDVVENALFDALNINKTLGSFLFDFAITTNPQPNATSFSLNDLGRHNILEHDASLTRADAYFGNVLAFNQTIFDETKQYWTDETLTIEMAARARVARIKTSQATNPEYVMSELGDSFTYGESMAYVAVFGDKITGTVKKAWVEWLFEHEEFPQHLGWRKPTEIFQEDDFDKYMDIIRNATEGLEGPACPQKKRRGTSHFGI